jgi:hypothetical protein
MRHKIILGAVFTAIICTILYFGTDAVDATLTVLRYH